MLSFPERSDINSQEPEGMEGLMGLGGTEAKNLDSERSARQHFYTLELVCSIIQRVMACNNQTLYEMCNE